jgi:hypothetical protein
MKRILNVICLAFIIGLIPFSLASGQEKKSEQRIKVVVSDGSDTKIVIDTVFNDALKHDSIRLKDGKVIYIGNRSTDASFITKDGADHILVTVSEDDSNNKKVVREITIVSSDSATWMAKENPGNRFVYNDTGTTDDPSEDHKVIRWTEKNNGSPEERVVIVKDGTVNEADGDKSFTYSIQSDVTDNMGSDYESTKYVIKKDGFVISIEGSDYEKVKELANAIEEKIDSGKDVPGKAGAKKK